MTSYVNCQNSPFYEYLGYKTNYDHPWGDVRWPPDAAWPTPAPAWVMAPMAAAGTNSAWAAADPRSGLAYPPRPRYPCSPNADGAAPGRSEVDHGAQQHSCAYVKEQITIARQIIGGTRCSASTFSTCVNLLAAKGFVQLLEHLLSQRPRLSFPQSDLDNAQHLRACLRASPQISPLRCHPTTFQQCVRAFAMRGHIAALHTLLDSRTRLGIASNELHAGYLLYTHICWAPTKTPRTQAYPSDRFTAVSRALAEVGEAEMLLGLRAKATALRLSELDCRRLEGEILRARVLANEAPTALRYYYEVLKSSRQQEVLMPLLASLIATNNMQAAVIVAQKDFRLLALELLQAGEYAAGVALGTHALR